MCWLKIYTLLHYVDLCWGALGSQMFWEPILIELYCLRGSRYSRFVYCGLCDLYCYVWPQNKLLTLCFNMWWCTNAFSDGTYTNDIVPFLRDCFLPMQANEFLTSLNAEMGVCFPALALALPNQHNHRLCTYTIFLFYSTPSLLQFILSVYLSTSFRAILWLGHYHHLLEREDSTGSPTEEEIISYISQKCLGLFLWPLA